MFRGGSLYTAGLAFTANALDPFEYHYQVLTGAAPCVVESFEYAISFNGGLSSSDAGEGFLDIRFEKYSSGSILTSMSVEPVEDGAATPTVTCGRGSGTNGFSTLLKTYRHSYPNRRAPVYINLGIVLSPSTRFQITVRGGANSTGITRHWPRITLREFH